MAVANGGIMRPKYKAILPLSDKLSQKEKVAFSFEELESGLFVSIGQLCDNDCIAIFSKFNVKS